MSSRGQLRGGDLVEQRLELVVVVAVDQHHVDTLVAELVGAGDAGEPATQHHDRHNDSSSRRSLRTMRPAAWIRARCENACGKFPRCRERSTSNSSAYRPNGDATRSRRSIRPVAPSMSPIAPSVAARLGIDERSAEGHVERIRLRLGFRSRAQIAAWYIAQRDRP